MMARQGWVRLFGAGMAALLLLNGCGKRQDRTALQEGLRTLDGRRYGSSILLFQKAIRDNVSPEDNALAYNGMGIAYWRIQQADNAVRSFENAARMNPALAEPVYNLGALKYESGKEAEAVICFEKAALIDPRATRSLEFLATIYQKRRQLDEARRVLADAQACVPRSPRVLTFLALQDLQTNNVAGAVALLQQALEHDSRYAPAIFNLAMLDRRQPNNQEQARAHFKDFLALVSEGPQADQARQALKELSESIPPTPTAGAPAPVVQESGAIVERPVAQAVVDLNPPPPAPMPPTAEDLLETAKKLQRTGRRAAAVNNYLKAAREAERARNGSLQERALRDASALCADDARSNYEVGLYYAEHKRNDKALPYLKHAVGLSTNWFDAQVALAKSALEEEEFDVARLMVKQAGQSRTESADALWDLALFCDRNASVQDMAPSVYASFAQQYPGDGRAGAARERNVALRAGAQSPDDKVQGSNGETNRSESSSSWWSHITPW
jgi:tetratricopeptide (TPR) repeat protein